VVLKITVPESLISGDLRIVHRDDMNALDDEAVPVCRDYTPSVYKSRHHMVWLELVKLAGVDIAVHVDQKDIADENLQKVEVHIPHVFCGHSRGLVVALDNALC
jgi:hypothetical protein